MSSRRFAHLIAVALLAGGLAACGSDAPNDNRSRNNDNPDASVDGGGGGGDVGPDEDAGPGEDSGPGEDAGGPTCDTSDPEADSDEDGVKNRFDICPCAVDPTQLLSLIHI